MGFYKVDTAGLKKHLKKINVVAKKKTKETKKEADIRRIIEASDFGCQKKNVASLMSAVTGLKIKMVETERCPAVGRVVVVLTNEIDNNDYETNTPLMVVCSSNSGGLINTEGKGGNCVTLTSRDVCRMATQKEINSFLKNMTEKTMVKIAKELDG